MGVMWVSTCKRMNDNMLSIHVCLILFLSIGVAFTKHLIQLYTFSGPNDLRQHLEVRCNDNNSLFYRQANFVKLNNFPTLSLQIDAHTGGVNDLAFAHPNKQLCFVTCGDDKLIKVE